MKKKFKLKLSVWQFLALGYLAATLLGSALLVLPFAAKDGQTTSYIDALFTATSAMCVTGLAPLDTGVHWSYFGQIVILLLIQTGGLGFMTFVSAMFLLIKKNIGLYERKAMIVSGGSSKYAGIKPLIIRIFIGTAAFELVGAFILSFRFVPDFGWGNGIYYSVWHSVSAFCNAGFDLMGAEGYASLSHYINDPLVTLTISALVIIGGIGFCVWGDITDSKLNPKKFQLNTKLVLTVTSVLLFVSTGLFLLFERDNPAYDGFNFGEKLLAAIFNATSPRTAGFYTTNPAELSSSGQVLTVILMFIGGNSGSTAGGIKVSTFAVIILGMFPIFRSRRDINIGKKRIDRTLLSQALAIFTACLMIIVFATMLICALEPDLTVTKVLFECVSALATVGLSLNVTPILSVGSKIILIVLMYLGRVGILTLSLALSAKRSAADVRRPIDNTLIIG